MSPFRGSRSTEPPRLLSWFIRRGRALGWQTWEQYLSTRWFPFGSDAAGEIPCFDLPSGTDEVYFVPYIGMLCGDAMLRYDPFADVAAAVQRTAEPGPAPDRGIR